MAPTQHDPTDEQWQTRFEHARELLNNVQREAELAHLVAQAHHATELTALCVYGASALARERRVGLLAGSYNPLTVAHVALAEAARHAARLDTLVWGVAAVTVDKEQVERASLPARLAQLQAYLACSHSPAAGDALVIFNHGLYVEQAQALRRLLAAEAELTIIVGFDKIVQILDPRYYENREQALARLFALARLLVAPRADQSEAALAALLAQPAN
ncbi:MAG TPA: hypothetical protein VKQ36_09220, partial [Ktedonobacterales bacterium]|nr:hypothetical protein [Ktedonobacterales bacterium]